MTLVNGTKPSSLLRGQTAWMVHVDAESCMWGPSPPHSQCRLQYSNPPESIENACDVVILLEQSHGFILWTWHVDEAVLELCTEMLVWNGVHLPEIVSPSLYLSSNLTLTGIISSLRIMKVIPSMELLQNSATATNVRIWLSMGLWRLVRRIFCFTVPPIPSQGDFPWLVAKNAHSASIPKSWLWWQRFNDALKLLYCPAHPSVKYKTFVTWGSFSLTNSITLLSNSCTKEVSCSRSSERMHNEMCLTSFPSL